MKVSLDHLVLTVRDLEKTAEFYETHLDMTREIFGDNRLALKFHQGKINLHQAGWEFEPKADKPTPGSADLCFIVSEDVETLKERLQSAGIEVIEGPVQRTGSSGPILSIYFRDPDRNLLELSNPLDG